MLICNEYYLTLIVNLTFKKKTHSLCNDYYLILFLLFLMFIKKFICIIGFLLPLIYIILYYVF
jgi:hypothetical protein